MTSQYEQISNLESLAGEWDELKAASLAPAIDPRQQEELLQTRHILEAVAKIGPEWSMPFYRELAASKGTEARQEAAELLAECPPGFRPENAVVLKSLLTDSVLVIRLRAAVGLILFEEPFGQDVILEALNSPNDWEHRQALEQLGRLPRLNQRTFALPRIKAIANDRLAHELTRAAANDLLRGGPQ